ncbi:MAG: UDP-2,4-diacetamido-2,4,6-trideoxy-beta-L-altropyranose hydrolase [Terriglobales bacterium]
MDNVLLIRADAGARIGAGHVMRCLALAEAWQAYAAGHRAVFMMAEAARGLEDRVRAGGFEIFRPAGTAGSAEDAKRTAEAARDLHAVWVVADSYCFGESCQRAVMASGAKLLFLDDYGHAGRYAADLVLNQNIGADAGWYQQREDHTRLLLGTRYALLRHEFCRWREWRREFAAKVGRVLVTLGGADFDNVTGLVVEALASVVDASVQVKVVAGSMNPNRDALRKQIERCGANFELVSATAGMPELMARADLAVSAAGGTCRELLFMQTPMVAISIAENQRPAAPALSEHGLAVAMDSDRITAGQIAAAVARLLEDAERRSGMGRRGREWVDGYGAERVCRAMLSSDGLLLERASEADCRLLWELANEPGVRAASFSSEPIPWNDHVQWFAERVHDGNTLLLIARDGADRPIGQVRFETEGVEAVISISVDRAARGKGYGVQLIRMATEQVFASREVKVIHAYIKPGNDDSLRAFVHAGYEKTDDTWIRGQRALHCVRRKE